MLDLRLDKTTLPNCRQQKSREPNRAVPALKIVVHRTKKKPEPTLVGPGSKIFVRHKHYRGAHACVNILKRQVIHLVSRIGHRSRRSRRWCTITRSRRCRGLSAIGGCRGRLSHRSRIIRRISPCLGSLVKTGHPPRTNFRVPPSVILPRFNVHAQCDTVTRTQSRRFRRTVVPKSYAEFPIELTRQIKNNLLFFPLAASTGARHLWQYGIDSQFKIHISQLLNRYLSIVHRP